MVREEAVAGDVVMLNGDAKAITNFSSEELKALAGKHSSEIRKSLGRSTAWLDVPIHRDL